MGPRIGLDGRKISSTPGFFLLYLIITCQYITVVGFAIGPFKQTLTVMPFISFHVMEVYIL